jgi:hypothetical protein
MPDDDKPDDPMALILAELRSLNRTLRMLANVRSSPATVADRAPTDLSRTCRD